ncbi:MAG: DUF2079 domain-containing protein [Acidimicrobiia bacterium]|nr:DUF2079 domain-containing protein [Acidimicrobiia bacterium]NNJ47662.1 DUF2079 domain-containing protein [Acidimicrobiia bacterium]
MTAPALPRLRSRPVAREDRRALMVVWIGTAVFAAVHAALIVGRFHRFGVYTFDFGIFDQGLWLLSRFDDPFVTLRGLNLFADHSSYIMVLLTPLYWIWADPRVLLVVTVVALAASGPLLFAIGRRIGLRPTLAAAISLAFLVHPAMRWATWDNFHPELLVPPLMLGALLLILNERPWWAFGLVAIALTAKEDVALVAVPFGLWVAWRYHRWAGLTMAAAATGAFALNFLVLLPAFSPTGEVLYTGRYTEYGTSALGIIGGVAANPVSVLGDITRADSLAYLRDMVLTAPTSLAAPVVLLLGLPITMANALSTHFYQIDIRYHYTIYLLTAVGIAALYGARWLQTRASRTAYGWIVAAVVLAAFLGLGPGPDGSAWDGLEDAAAVEAAIDLIGPDDVVSANSTLAVHLAHRTTVYRFPNPFRELDYGTPGIDYDPPAGDVEWIILDPNRLVNFAYANETLTELLADRTNPWEPVISTDGVLLLRRR